MDNIVGDGLKVGNANWNFKGKVSKNFDIEPVKQIKLIREKISFYENLGLNQGEIDSILGIKTDSQGRYVYIEAKGISVRYDLPRD